jgi:hypothetical protein
MRTSLYAMRNATTIDKESLCVHAMRGPVGGPILGVNGTSATHPSRMRVRVRVRVRVRGADHSPVSMFPRTEISGDIVALGWWGPSERDMAPFQWMKAPEYSPMDVLDQVGVGRHARLAACALPDCHRGDAGYGQVPCDDTESGYVPCDDNCAFCLAPDGGYPEFSKPLVGAPAGPAVEPG